MANPTHTTHQDGAAPTGAAAFPKPVTLPDGVTDDDILLSDEQVSVMLNISENTLKKWRSIGRNKLKTVKLGDSNRATVRTPLSSVRALIAENMQEVAV